MIKDRIFDIKTNKNISMDDNNKQVNAFNIIKLKEICSTINEQIHECNKLKPSRELSLAITKCQEGVLWFEQYVKLLEKE